MKPNTVRKTLNRIVSGIAKYPYLFTNRWRTDFTRNRKIGISDVILAILGMEGKSLPNELCEFYHHKKTMPTVSAFVQQRAKIKSDTFEFLFREFTERCAQSDGFYRGYRLLAADGSHVQIAGDPSDVESYIAPSDGQKPYSMLHLNALYDLNRRIYLDAVVQKYRRQNEHKALVTMIDRSPIPSAILLADRGYESYNNMAHCQEKGWKYLFRIRDNHSCMLSCLDLPHSDEFDLPVCLHLTRRQRKSTKHLLKDKNHYRIISSNNTFDYLILNETPDFYTLPFRVVRFRISDTDFETVVTNLDPTEFPPDELKKLYSLRWGIETSFRYLKHTIGLLHFHAKKVEHILQEIFARLTMYNFSELITSRVVIQKSGRKHDYSVNFSASVHICRQFFRGNVSPPNLETLIARNLSPIRPGRHRPRKVTQKPSVSFIYRIA